MWYSLLLPYALAYSYLLTCLLTYLLARAGTTFQFTEDYKNEKREYKKMLKLNQAAKEKEDIILPEDAQIHVSNTLVASDAPVTPVGSPVRDNKNAAGTYSLTHSLTHLLAYSLTYFLE